MTKLKVASALVAALFANMAWSESSKPEYCEGFDMATCERIQEVVQSQQVPDYCVLGFGTPSIARSLTDEQLRICYVVAGHSSNRSKAQPKQNPNANRDKVVADARAALKVGWKKYLRVIEDIEVAYKCEVVDQTSAEAAVANIQVAMQDEQIELGLLGDQTVNILAASEEAVQSGKVRAERGECHRLSSAWRGQERLIVSKWMQRG